MATIPTYGFDNVQEHATQEAGPQLAPPSAFPGGVGHALAGATNEIASVYLEARRTQAREEGERAATVYLNKALDIRGEYTQNILGDAIEKHPEAVEKMNRLRQEIRDHLSSRYAQDSFATASEYTLRRELEMMENHFTTQRKALSAVTDKAYTAAELRTINATVEQLARDKPPPAQVMKIIDTLMNSFRHKPPPKPKNDGPVAVPVDEQGGK